MNKVLISRLTSSVLVSLVLIPFTPFLRALCFSLIYRLLLFSPFGPLVDFVLFWTLLPGQTRPGYRATPWTTTQVSATPSQLTSLTDQSFTLVLGEIQDKKTNLHEIISNVFVEKSRCDELF